MILQRIRKEYAENSTFSYTFRFDVQGTSHWLGIPMCVDVLDGGCHLGRVKRTRMRWSVNHRRKMDVSLDVDLDETGRTFLGLVNDLDVDTLLAAIGVVAVADVMGE